MELTPELSHQLFELRTATEAEQWLASVEQALGSLPWKPLGGFENNIHAVEAATDSAGALAERVTNSIDAVLDLMAVKKHDTTSTPHEAATRWYAIPPGGISEMKRADRQKLADHIRVLNVDSGRKAQPTVRILDRGTGQHPDSFENTLLSLMASNKKSKTHQMGVYNAGGAATYAFAHLTAVVSRREPSILGGAIDEVGVALVRYNELDPDRFKTGRYEYCVGPDDAVLRLELAGNELPDTGWGTHTIHFGYELSKYSGPAYAPTGSLHHLFHAALPDPPLPFWVEEHRKFPAMRGDRERRVVTGLLARLKSPDVADYQDERPMELGPDAGKAILRYFVVNEDQDPDAFTTSQQGVALLFNGQRHGTKDRYWVKRNTSLGYVWRRLVVLIDCNGLTNEAKREVFASTREQSKDSPLTRRILDRVRQELDSDEDLLALDERARQQVLAAATSSTSERVKKQLAGQIASTLKGSGPGRRGGGKKPPSGGAGERTPRDLSDDHLLAVPDELVILDDPVRIRPGTTRSMRLHINAKNGFLPQHADGLSVVIGQQLNEHVRLVSTGKLLGGQVRLTLEADADAPITDSALQVALVVPPLSLMLTAQGKVELYEPNNTKDSSDSGGEPDIDIHWVGREAWAQFEPPWDEQVVGDVHITRDSDDEELITRVEWYFNEAFAPYEQVIGAKQVGQDQTNKLRERYELPVCWGMFQQSMAEAAHEKHVEEEGRAVEIPDDYVRAERARLARAVLMAMEPALAVAAQAED
jgi:hypothetical protein